ncbi:MAG: diguanylate cyclase [Oscillospiraceae bacterium]
MTIGKKSFAKNRRSIAFRWTVGILAIIFAQSLLLSVILLAGGVVSKARDNAYQSFSEKTENRKNDLQSEMVGRWGNIDLYADQISQALAVLGDAPVPEAKAVDSFFETAAPILISMLRESATTDVFVILNDDTAADSTHSALYFRDYDPLVGSKQNSDLRLLVGPTEIARQNGTMTGDTWSYGLVLDSGNQAFYRQPYDNGHLSSDAGLLGYWSAPFRLTSGSEPAITYSRPLFDQNGQLRGVIGTGVSMQYFSTLLPATELGKQMPLGYTMGLRTAPDGAIVPMASGNPLQSRMLTLEGPLTFTKYDEKTDIGPLENGIAHDPVYACVKHLELYAHNTPFEGEQWYLVGLMAEDDLLDFTERIGSLLLISFLISVPLGAIYGILASRRFTKPIISLVERVRESEQSESISLGKTGLAEIDELAGAIESANRKIMLQRDYDNLTGLRTNQLFKREVTALLEQEPEKMGVSAMLMMDLDDFKQVNDTYGHHWGDTYLKTAAQLLMEVFAENAVVGRRSGDEFHVFLYGGQTREQMLDRVSSLYDALKNCPLTQPDGTAICIGISAGLVWQEGAESCDQLLLQADGALYEAKRSHKGSFAVGGTPS